MHENRSRAASNPRWAMGTFLEREDGIDPLVRTVGTGKQSFYAPPKTLLMTVESFLVVLSVKPLFGWGHWKLRACT